MGYLDSAGLSHLWGRVIAALSGKADLDPATGKVPPEQLPAMGGCWYRSFEAEQWSGGTLRIPKREHGITPTQQACMCRLRQRVDGTMVSNTWSVLESRTYWDLATGELVLEGSEPFAGDLMVVG